jgi:hypothetical protein
MKECCEFQREECCKCKYRMFCEDCPIESAEEQSDGDIDESIIKFFKKIGWID